MPPITVAWPRGRVRAGAQTEEGRAWEEGARRTNSCTAEQFHYIISCQEGLPISGLALAWFSVAPGTPRRPCPPARGVLPNKDANPRAVATRALMVYNTRRDRYDPNPR